jgi:hypothetical protein
MSVDTSKKPMATIASCTDQEIIRAVQSGLANLAEVRSVYFLNAENAFSVWVDISEDSESVKDTVYRFEDQLSARFPQYLFDFHVVPVPNGRKLSDFVSVAKPIYQRTA